MAGSVSVVAGGNISPNCFVKLSTTADRTVLMAGAGDRIFGVSQQFHRFPPWEGLDDGYIAIANESCSVWTMDTNTEALVQCGGTVTQGDYVKSDGSGHAVTAGSDGDEFGGQALESGVSGTLIKVLLKSGMRGA